jgi:hypothetical protein
MQIEGEVTLQKAFNQALEIAKSTNCAVKMNYKNVDLFVGDMAVFEQVHSNYTSALEGLLQEKGIET